MEWVWESSSDETPQYIYIATQITGQGTNWSVFVERVGSVNPKLEKC